MVPQSFPATFKPVPHLGRQDPVRDLPRHQDQGPPGRETDCAYSAQSSKVSTLPAGLGAGLELVEDLQGPGYNSG
jgi:hypothetical protein